MLFQGKIIFDKLLFYIYLLIVMADNSLCSTASKCLIIYE